MSTEAAQRSTPPKTTRIAITGLWLGLGGQILVGLLPFFLGPRVRYPFPFVYPLAFGVVTTGIIVFFTYMISRQKNWARIIYAIVYGLSSFGPFSGIGGIIALVKYNLPYAIPRAILELILTCSVVLLFFPASNQWFRRRLNPPPAPATAG